MWVPPYGSGCIPRGGRTPEEGGKGRCPAAAGAAQWRERHGAAAEAVQRHVEMLRVLQEAQAAAQAQLEGTTLRLQAAQRPAAVNGMGERGRRGWGADRRAPSRKGGGGARPGEGSCLGGATVP